jgi:dihydrodiol dehydrogenase / D-xylose 1-dehydrogenase (NADP)
MLMRLAVGVYSITWIFLFLYHIKPVAERKAPLVASSITKFSKTGSDEATTVIMTFPPDGTQGIATTSLRVNFMVEMLHSWLTSLGFR